MCRMSPPKLRLVLIGWGAIARRVAALLAERQAPVEIVGVAVRDAAVPRAGLPPGAALIDDPAHLAALRPTLVLEAAGRASVAVWAHEALAAGADVALASTSALVDDTLREALVAQARACGRQLLVPPGALGAVDALAAASRAPLARVRHEIVKPPQAWRGTAAELLVDLDALAAPCTFFEGSAAEAAGRFPQNANVAAITALAGLGLARTEVALVADPAATGNRHRLLAEGDFGRLELVLDNRALADNPKSSALTALSLVRLVENRTAPLVV